MKKDFKLNIALRGIKAGKIISLEVNPEGLPLDSYWNRRMKEARLNKCIEVVKTVKERKE